MRMRRKFILAGAAVAGLTAAGALAADNSHVLTLRLPDGSQEQIRYTGDVAPRVRILSGPQAFVALAPIVDPFGPGSAFAAMRRMSAAMDRNAELMLRRAQTLSAGGEGLKPVDLGTLPPGARGYTMVSTFSGGKMCTRTNEYSAAAAGRPTKILTRSSGDCGPARTGGPQMTAAPAPQPPAVQAPALSRTAYKASPGTPSVAD